MEHPYILILAKDEIFNSYDHFDDCVDIAPAFLVQRGRCWRSVWNPGTKRLLYFLTRTDITHWSRPRSVICSFSQGVIWHHFNRELRFFSSKNYQEPATTVTLVSIFQVNSFSATGKVLLQGWIPVSRQLLQCLTRTDTRHWSRSACQEVILITWPLH